MGKGYDPPKRFNIAERWQTLQDQIDQLRGYGDIYYVDATNGNDDADGADPSRPWKTTTYAISQVTDWNNDVVWHKGYENIASGSITINKNKMSLLGYAGQGANPYYPESGSLDRSVAGAAAVVIVDAEFVELGGLAFNAQYTTGAVETPAVRINEGANKAYIHDCFIPDWNRANMRMGLQIEGAHYTVVERLNVHSVYGNIDVGIGFTGGSGANPAYGTYKDCSFRGIAGALAAGFREVDGTWQDFLVEDCKFSRVTNMALIGGDAARYGQFKDCGGDMLEAALIAGTGSGADDKQALWTNHKISMINCWGRDALIADS